MSLSPAIVTAYSMRRSHEAMLRIVADLSEEQLKSSAPNSPSIAFHLWHAARWADLLQAKVPGMTEELGKRLGPATQIWQADSLAQRWGLAPASLGSDENGMGMDDDVSVSLPLPDKAQLIDYAGAAFEAANRAVAAADDEQLAENCIDMYGRETSVGAAVISHLTHVNRHLGMIEALRGVHSLRGTATV